MIPSGLPEIPEEDFAGDRSCEQVSDDMLGIPEYKFPNLFSKYLTSPLTVTSGLYQPRVSLFALHCLAVSFSFCESYGTFHLALSSLDTSSNSHDNTFLGSKIHLSKITVKL